MDVKANQIPAAGALAALQFFPLASASQIPALSPDGSAWTTSDRVTLDIRSWGPEDNPRAVVVAVHGLCGAADDFQPLGDHLAARGVRTMAFHLRSQAFDPDPERRGHLNDFRLLVRDLDEFCALVADLYPETPRLVFGESMGAMISILASTHAPELPVDLLILSSPVVSVRMKTAPWQDLLFALAESFAPRLRVCPASFAPRDAPPPRMTRDDAYQTKLEASPQQIDAFTLRFLKNLRAMMDSADQSARLVRHPSLILYAGNDFFVPPSAVEDFHSRIVHPNKEIRFFPESYHLLLHDHDRQEVLDAVELWIFTHIAG